MNILQLCGLSAAHLSAPIKIIVIVIAIAIAVSIIITELFIISSTVGGATTSVDTNPRLQFPFQCAKNA